MIYDYVVKFSFSWAFTAIIHMIVSTLPKVYQDIIITIARLSMCLIVILYTIILRKANITVYPPYILIHLSKN